MRRLADVLAGHELVGALYQYLTFVPAEELASLSACGCGIHFRVCSPQFFFRVGDKPGSLLWLALEVGGAESVSRRV